MTKRLLMSVAAAALIAGTGFANAQGAGMGREGGGAGGAAPAARSAPGGAGAGGAAAGGAADRAAPMEKSAPAGRDEATDTTNRSDQRQDQKAQSDDKMQRDNGSRNATDTTRDNGKAGNKDMKAEGNNPDAKNSKAAADDKGTTNNKAAGNDAKSTTTTGQAGAGAKLTTEQRTKVTTVIKQQNIKPVTNVNFNISIGTRVPRDVQFHPLPAEIVTVYPDWRGYDFILVNDQIIVINPSSYEIIAVIDA